jgi:hypothetical protein
VTGSTVSTESISKGEAEARALAAEESYVTDRLIDAACVTDWELASYAGFEKRATVADRGAEGVEVSVSQPYTYSTERETADTGSKARYLVASDSTQRVGGDDVSLC